MGLTSKLAMALDVPIHFSQADRSGLVWLERSIRKHPFCQCLNRQRDICRRCASACFPSTCFELDHEGQIGTAVFHFSCLLAIYLVTPVSIDGSFCGVLGCGPIVLEEPTREIFERALAGLDQEIPTADQQELWHAYKNAPVFQTSRMKAITSLLPEFAKLLGSDSCASSAPYELPGPPEELALIDRVLELIRNHDDGEITITSMAKELHVSAAHLSRNFRQMVGMPLHVYVNQARVARAKALMESSSTKCIDVAFESGFNSKAAFNRWFMKLTGQTPRSFRLAPKKAESTAKGAPTTKPAAGNG